MIKINLIPKEIEEKAVARRKTIMVTGIGVVVVLIFAGLYIMRVATLNAKNARIDTVEKELNELKPVVRKVNDIKESKAQLDRKIEVIKNLMESRLLYPVFMEEIARIIPTGVWLTNLNTNTEDLSLRLNIGVRAVNNYAVADFINELETSEKFSNIQFPGINTEIDYYGDEVRRFNITCLYRSSSVGDK